MGSDKPAYIPKTCLHCNQPAEVHARWLARKSIAESVPQQAVFCKGCAQKVWDMWKNTQFGQTLQLEPLT